MNRNDKLIVALLFLTLMGWLWYSNDAANKARERALAERSAIGALSTNTATTATLVQATNVPVIASTPLPDIVVQVPPTPTVHLLPEETNVLHSAEMDLMISSRGATLRAATLPAYRTRPEKNSGPVILDFDPQPALALSGLPDVPIDADYSVRSGSNNTLTLTFVTQHGLQVQRTIALREYHQVVVTDRITNTSEIPLKVGTNWVSLGTFYRGGSKNDELSVDSFAIAPENKVRHWSTVLPGLFGGGGAFACPGQGRALQDSVQQTTTGAQHWVALKSRFFVQAFAPSVANTAFHFEAVRDTRKPAFALSHISGAVAFPGALLAQNQSIERSYQLYIGPKKLAYLTALGQNRNEIMEFGFFSWFCKPLVPLLNFFYEHLVKNYGVAIILLTLLVRLVFWPLTHKSTESAKRMRDVQPKIKAVQEQFKDDPHKMQQEVWKIYRENKVNPFSSCLPMLVQLPVFIALYTVLRSAVELRFAPFLWVSDLSEPENLFAGVFPFAINILPLVMAGVTIVQSKLTPAMGDPAQQKMMTWMMPLMMLFFFYSMPAALSLYWTVSTILAIGQLWWQQRTPRAEVAAVDAATDPEKMTRQMRRRMER